MPRVFIVQRPMRKDDKGQLWDRFDLQPATTYGELVELLTPTANPFNPPHIIDELHEKLETFSDEDYLVLIGNPVLIGWCVAIAAYYNDGRVTCLQWSGSNHRYIPVPADILLAPEEDAEVQEND